MFLYFVFWKCEVEELQFRLQMAEEFDNTI